jgi:OTU domain-containing protein 6
MSDTPETLEGLQARHRKEQRDLVSRTTQKKKAATKKTRKGVNDECERLERELKERQAEELSRLKGEKVEGDLAQGIEEEGSDAGHDVEQVNDVEKAVGNLSIASLQEGNGPTEPNGTTKKPNRAKARLARRAAEQEALVVQAKEEAANMPNLREQERARMAQQLGKRNLQLKEIRADGHCLYAAVADQMETQGLGLKPRIQPKIIGEGEEQKLPDYKKVRYAAAEFIAQNSDDFAGFLEEPLEQYLQKIRETGEWGGHMELTALAKTYGVKIKVLHGDGRVDEILPEGSDAGEDVKEIWLGYYKHSHGLGEHYNSLRKVP